jgi:hypothetical protein
MSGFVVTSLRHAAYDARTLYEDLYYARREAESRIGEQFELWADHASWATMAANQLRSVVFGNRPRPWSMQRTATRYATRSLRMPRSQPPPQAAQARRPRGHQWAPRSFRHRFKLPEPARVPRQSRVHIHRFLQFLQRAS